jgi:hypothetical protein
MKIKGVKIEKDGNIEEINLDENSLILLSISPEKCIKSCIKNCMLLARPANIDTNLVHPELVIESMKRFIEKFKERMKEEEQSWN